MSSAIFRHTLLRSIPQVGLLCAALCLLTVPVQAQTQPSGIYTFFLDTSSLTSGDQYAVDLQLNQGDAGGSLITLSNFSFGSGQAIPDAGGGITDRNGATGDFSGSVTLDEQTTSYPEFTQEFTNGGKTGSTVNFTVDASQLSSTSQGGQPDTFQFGLIDTSLQNPQDPTAPVYIASTNTENPTSLLTITRSDSGYSVNSYGYTGTDGAVHSVETPNVSAAPEPSSRATVGLVVLGVGGLLLRARRKQAKTAT